MSRKVSVDSIRDPWADDLLHSLYDLIFRRRNGAGWIAASAFLAVPSAIAVLCLVDGNMLGGTVFTVISISVLSLRLLCLRRSGGSKQAISKGRAIDRANAHSRG